MWRCAEERGLIRVVDHDRRTNVRLAHPLYGEVVRRRCPVIRTRRLQGAAWPTWSRQAGARRRDDLLRVAVWRLDSGTAQDPRPLLRAGGQAFARFDVPLAARLARAALNAGGGFDAAELLATILMFGDQPRRGASPCSTRSPTGHLRPAARPLAGRARPGLATGG